MQRCISFKKSLFDFLPFTTGEFLMFFARCAYSSVLNVSSTECEAGDTVAMMHVRDFPPNASRSNLVSLLSRYGMCTDLSTSAVMTRPSATSDVLIAPASFARLSLAPDREMFSLPAKSTRFSLPVRTNSSPSGDTSVQ